MNVFKNLAIIKLVTGEDIIGTLKHTKNEVGEESFTINFPLALVITPGGNIGVRPWMLCKEAKSEDGEIMISPFSIVAIATPDDELINAYNDVITQQKTNIITPTKTQQKIITH